jgi:hypothetical protein
MKFGILLTQFLVVMMKKLILIFCLLLLTTVANSQSQQFFDSPFGGGGGFTADWTFTNVNSLNNKLVSINMPQVASKGIFTSGGGGFIYIGFVPGFRVGGMGYGGSTSNKSTLSDPNGLLYNSETQYSCGGGGLTVEYTLPFIKSIGVSPGLIIGGGNTTVELYQNRWEMTWNNLGANTNSYLNFHKTLKNNYWIISPTLNVDIPFYRFLCFRVGVGYNFTLSEEWKLDNDQSISNVPSDFNGRNFFIQSGILIGFFSF